MSEASRLDGSQVLHRVVHGELPQSRRTVARAAPEARRSRALQWVILGLALGACARPQNTDARAPQSDEAQSIAEYDVAVDLFGRPGQERMALEKALEATRLDEDNADAAHLVAIIYLSFCQRDALECHLDEANRAATRALEARPDFREARNTLGVVQIHQGRFADAIATLKPLTEDILYQTPEIAWGNLGWAYLDAGQLEPAIEALRRSTAIQPAFCVGHYRLALAYEKRGDASTAHTHYTRALEVDPRCKTLQAAYSGRARVALALGRQDSALIDLQTCVRLAPATPSGRECKALLSQSPPPAPAPQ